MSELGHEAIQVGGALDGLSLAIQPRAKSSYLRTKRCLDIAITIVVAPAALAIIVIAALLVSLDGGRAFYGQQRVGRNGRTFTIWKLRTMHQNAAEMLEKHLLEDPEALLEWNTHQKLRQDPRVTTVGRYLRKYSIDELPQLANVVLGEMSIVGPRPMLPSQRSQYPGTAYYSLRPGLTGMWQVSERHSSSFAERANYDNKYAASISLGTDLGLMVRTARVVLHGTGV